FINTIPLRVKLEDSMSFKDLLISINKSFLESNEYDFYPLAKIQSFSEAKEKLINNIMVFENYPVDDEGLNTELLIKNDLQIIDFSGKEQTNYNFNLVVGYKDIIAIKFQFNELLYSKNNVEKIKNHFVNLIDEIITNENILVKDMEILGEDEKNKLLIEFNKTEAHYPNNKTIQELFEEQVEKTPNNIAVVFENKSITYKELNERANSLASILRNNGVGPDDIVGIMTERSINMIVGIMAIIKAGGAYLPIDPKYPQNRIEYILENSKIKTILVRSNFKEKIKQKIDIYDLNDESLYNGNVNNLKKNIKENNLAYVIYTSGTTGNPKGV
ncbi:AMP-binding protein, partial [Clostridium cavendishii]